jgi:hypothetical protein
MPQGKIPYKKNRFQMGTSNLRLRMPIGSDSNYGKAFDIGTNIAETLSRDNASTVWDKYVEQAYTATDTLKRYPSQAAGALLLHQSAKKMGIDIRGGSVNLPTKYGSFEIGKIKGGAGIKFNLNKSILKKLEQKLMR